MKKILCPTDFSDAANNAVAYAAKFARRMHAEILLLNVQSIFSMEPGELLTNNPPSVKRTEQILETQAREVTKTFGIICNSEVLVSDESLSSIITAREEKFDLILMGTSGPDDLQKFFFGSNTYHVLRNSGTPLIFIPDMIRFSDIKRIIYSYDYLHKGVPPLDNLKDIFSGLDSEVIFLQLTRGELNEEEQLVLERNTEAIIEALDEDFPVRFEHLSSQDYATTIQKQMLQSDADMLVISTHPYSMAEKLFHKSLAKKISMDFMYPVLIVHQ